MGLELLSIIVGLLTFNDLIIGSTVRVWSDNIGADRALAKGAVVMRDHNLIVHGIWALALKLNIGIWIERVASEDNIADLPSRRKYKLLKRLGADKRDAVFPCASVYFTGETPEEEVLSMLAALATTCHLADERSA